jgi:hypothetical protein
MKVIDNEICEIVTPKGYEHKHTKI